MDPHNIIMFFWTSRTVWILFWVDPHNKESVIADPQKEEFLIVFPREKIPHCGSDTQLRSLDISKRRLKKPTGSKHQSSNCEIRTIRIL